MGIILIIIGAILLYTLIYIISLNNDTNSSTDNTYTDISSTETSNIITDNIISNNNDVELTQFINLEKKYKSILDKHFALLNKINIEYSKANKLNNPNSTQMQKVINLCLQDISLAPKFLEYNIKEAKLYNTSLENWLPRLSFF